MPAEPKSEFHFEIAHVLLIDVVGYSKLLIDEQSEVLQTLNDIGAENRALSAWQKGRAN
jgi:hypothetical protein